jgi:hypothetical protein
MNRDRPLVSHNSRAEGVSYASVLHGYVLDSNQKAEQGVTLHKARHIAANVAELPELLRKPPKKPLHPTRGKDAAGREEAATLLKIPLVGFSSMTFL